jgi:hypothetical protein
MPKTLGHSGKILMVKNYNKKNWGSFGIFVLPYNFGQIMKVEKKNPFMPKIPGQHHEHYNFHGA